MAAIVLIVLAAFFVLATMPLAHAQEKLVKFRFVHLEANGSQAVPFIAKEARIFEKNGLDMEIIRIGGGSRVIQAMLAGEIRVAHGSSPAVVEANLSGADLVIIASTVNVATFRMMAAPSIKSPGDLKGKKIGISRFGGQTDTLTRHLFEKWQIDPKEVTLLQTGGGAETAAAMVSRGIDAALVRAPEHAELLCALGKLGLRTHDAALALEYTGRCLRVNPVFADGWYLHGLAREAAGDAMGAERAYQRQFALVPGHERALERRRRRLERRNAMSPGSARR